MSFIEECGVFGIYGHPDAAELTALGLHALQHRGQEACGIISYNGKEFLAHRATGLVSDNFNQADVIKDLQGNSAIGHTRYSTTGESQIRNVQPLYADFDFGGFAIAHNGNLTNAMSIKEELVNQGSIFQSTSDTEVLIHLMAKTAISPAYKRLINACKRVEGAYSITGLFDDKLIGIRGPLGVRPLVLGYISTNNKNAYVLASETCALDIIGAKIIKEIEAGEIVIIDNNGYRFEKPFTPVATKFCIFEYVYFSRPDSQLNGLSVYNVRQKIGNELAKETFVDADVTVPVPDSGVPAAMGYAQESKIPYELGIIRNHYVGRTFIEPTDNIRHLGVRLKHNANKEVLNGKRVVLIDDSIVRGTTIKKIVEMVRVAGAKEVHVRVSSPPTMNPCFYGIDTPKHNNLMAYNYSINKMRQLIKADSLKFLSIEGLYKAIGFNRNKNEPQFCDACFTGKYPTKIDFED